MESVNCIYKNHIGGTENQRFHDLKWVKNIARKEIETIKDVKNHEMMKCTRKFPINQSTVKNPHIESWYNRNLQPEIVYFISNN